MKTEATSSVLSPTARASVARVAIPLLRRALDRDRCVALCGPYEIGKSHLARAVADLDGPSHQLSAGKQDDRTKLLGPAGLIANAGGALIIIDDVQASSDCVRAVRDELERADRRERAPGRFLLLGSSTREVFGLGASILGSRVTPFDLSFLTLEDIQSHSRDPVASISLDAELEGEAEIERVDPNQTAAEDGLWLRGGLPTSFLADDDETSFAFRDRYVEQLATRCGALWNVSASVVREFLERMALAHGSTMSGSNLGKLPVEMRPLVGHSIDLGLVRRLFPYHPHRSRQLEKESKYYIRDSGVLHCLRKKLTRAEVCADTMLYGASWEGHCIEALAQAAQGMPLYFYRENEESEVDLLIEVSPGRFWAVEIKGGKAAPSAGFYAGATAVDAKRKIVVRKSVGRMTSTGVEIMTLRAAVEAVRHVSTEQAGKL